MTVEVERTEDTLRAFDDGKSSEGLDQFKAIGTVRYYGDTAILDRVKGELRKRDVIDAYKACKAGGARWLLSKRKDGHTLPMGNIMPDGHPFAGWWYVDLNEVK